MIGTPDDELISGFETPAFDVSAVNAGNAGKIGADKVNANRLAIAAALEAAQQAVVDKVHEVKLAERKRKSDLESTKDTEMQNNTDEHARQQYLFKTFVPELRKIGLSKSLLETELRAVGPAVLKVFKDAVGKLDAGKVDNAKLDWKPNAGGYAFVLEALGRHFKLLVLYKGAEGYVVSLRSGHDGLLRDVYAKRLGKLADKGDFKSGDANQYVKDDNGFLTRRWAWGYKTLGASKVLMGDIGKLKGRYAAAGNKVKSIDEKLKRQYPILKNKAELSTPEVLFVNQEKGSGPQQRGVCLSSSPNKTIHGNKGETFEHDEETDLDNILIKVDLAKVPSDQELLFNLYTQEAQAVTIGLPGRNKGKPFNAKWAKKHTDTSTAKNREIYLRKLTKDEVANADHVTAEIVRLDQVLEDRNKVAKPVTPVKI